MITYWFVTFTDNRESASIQYLPWLGTSQNTRSSSTPHQESSHSPLEDCVFNYASSTLFLGLFVKQLTDAVHEGDADREDLCWKLMLLLFKVKIKNRNRTKYAYTAMKYLCMTKVILTPRMALKLKWGKYFNDTGKPGGCIPIDQRVEHEVRDVKDHFARLQKNLNETSAQRYCHSQSKGQTILTNIDRVLGVTPQSKGHSTVSSADDVEIMVRELSQRDVFSKIPGRCHSAFPNHPRNLLECLDMGELKRWMTKLVKKFSSGQYLYGGPEIDSDQSDSDEE